MVDVQEALGLCFN